MMDVNNNINNYDDFKKSWKKAMSCAGDAKELEKIYQAATQFLKLNPEYSLHAESKLQDIRELRDAFEPSLVEEVQELFTEAVKEKAERAADAMRKVAFAEELYQTKEFEVDEIRISTKKSKFSEKIKNFLDKRIYNSNGQQVNKEPFIIALSTLIENPSEGNYQAFIESVRDLARDSSFIRRMSMDKKVTEDVPISNWIDGFIKFIEDNKDLLLNSP